MKLVRYYALGALLLCSCDCYQVVDGIVVDAQTGQPLADARVQKQGNLAFPVTTDAQGRFHVAEIAGGWSCPPMRVAVEAPGYHAQEVLIPAGGTQRVKLEREAQQVPDTPQ
ncbi:carboxypeptidase-like regulatory domain-containing protein [Hymenobacter sp. B1770]|uniref:carboxypeptidase-like regulatory domain-containing protein n=1 Tax=Hymenobacter sp. B1770 TaxID=1718788 RepID=UPI003CEC6DAC